MKWDTEFLFIALYKITKTIVRTTTRVVQREIDSIGSTLEKNINNHSCEELNKYEQFDTNQQKLEKYILFSMGGIDNVVFARPYQDGYMFVFWKLDKVQYYNFKNLGARVWVSEKRGSIILKPRNSQLSIDMNEYLKGLFINLENTNRIGG